MITRIIAIKNLKKYIGQDLSKLAGRNIERSELLKVQSFDFLENDTLIQEIQTDYEFIRNKLIKEGFDELTGKDGKWIQARTKGKEHGSISREFYARKSLINEIIKLD